MFFHHLKYSFFILIRNRVQMYWSVLFIVAMGTLFKACLGDVYEQSEVAHDIPVAAFFEDQEVGTNFREKLVENLVDADGAKMFTVRETETMEDAVRLLDSGEVLGVYYSENGELKLLVSEKDTRESILASVVSEYHRLMTVMKELEGKPQNMIAAAMSALLTDNDSNTEINGEKKNMDVFDTYFYNLIAMACLMSVLTGTNITILNNPGMSLQGTRKYVSGVGMFTERAAGFVAAAVVQFLCAVIGFFYLNLIGVKLGTRVGWMLLIILMGVIASLAIGFFIGNLRFSARVKDGIGTAVSVGLAFFSGLMLWEMRMVVEKACPVFNDVNPAVLISDSFYVLNFYEDLDRFFLNMITLFAISVFFFVLGNLIGGRNKNVDISRAS